MEKLHLYDWLLIIIAIAGILRVWYERYQEGKE
jgi:hypothetical protein